MTLSDLQQIICDKETELAQMRKAAIDAAQHQALEMMKLEMEHAHQENELTMREAIQRVESEAVAGIESAKQEMEHHVQQREAEMFEAASLKMEEEWTSREEYLCKEFQTVLSTELKGQHDKLSNQYEAELIQKDNATKAYEDSKNYQLANIEENYNTNMSWKVW